MLSNGKWEGAKNINLGLKQRNLQTDLKQRSPDISLGNGLEQISVVLLMSGALNKRVQV